MISIGPVATRPASHVPRPRPSAGAALFVGLVVLAGVAAMLLTGEPAAGVGPILLVIALALFWKAPIRYTLVLFMGLFAVVTIPEKTLPGAEGTGQTWKSPVFPIHNVLAENLSKVTHVEALRFSGMELFYVIVLAIIAVRVIAGSPVDSAGRQPTARVTYFFLALALLEVVFLEVWGLGRGGDFRQSLWQFRNLLWLPVLAFVFAYCMRDVRDFRFMAVTMTVAAWLKILLGLQYMVFVAWPAGLSPESMTIHEDSVLFVTVIAIWVTAWLHEPTRRTFVRMLMACSLVFVGLVVNNRRIAFVSLLVGICVAVLMLRGRVKRRIIRSLAVAMPVIGLYLLAGRNHTSGIFKPAALVMSVSQQKDGSSKTRDIENFNLIQTLKPNKLLGSGWGHEYDEVNKAYDISEAFAQYRFIAHNSVLWLLSIGGIVGFTIIWLPVSVTVFLAARSYRFARTPYEQTVAVSVIAVMITYLVQAWGDMGTQGVSTSLIVAGAMAAAGKLAHATGAWPSHIRLFGAGRGRRFRAAGPLEPPVR